MQGMGEKDELRIEMRFGVPGDGDAPGKPREGERQRADDKERRGQGIGPTFRVARIFADSLHRHGSSGFPPRLKAAPEACG